VKCKELYASTEQPRRGYAQFTDFRKRDAIIGGGVKTSGRKLKDVAERSSLLKEPAWERCRFNETGFVHAGKTRNQNGRRGLGPEG